MQVRTEVFVVEQQVPAEIELDEHDPQAWHLVAYLEGEPVGTLRIFADATGQWYLGRMAVMAAQRGQGLGRLLLTEALTKARELRVPSLEIHAQTHALDFYAKLGFVAFGEVFMEAGIPHQMMVLVLSGG